MIQNGEFNSNVKKFKENLRLLFARSKKDTDQYDKKILLCTLISWLLILFSKIQLLFTLLILYILCMSKKMQLLTKKLMKW